MRGLIDPKGPPVTMGHEGVGIVEKIGSGVKGFKEGDRIGFLYFRGACCESPVVDSSLVCKLRLRMHSSMRRLRRTSSAVRNRKAATTGFRMRWVLRRVRSGRLP
jgi:Zn-dependent alcohol dehydrogenase